MATLTATQKAFAIMTSTKREFTSVEVSDGFKTFLDEKKFKISEHLFEKLLPCFIQYEEIFNANYDKFSSDDADMLADVFNECREDFKSLRVDLDTTLMAWAVDVDLYPENFSLSFKTGDGYAHPFANTAQMSGVWELDNNSQSLRFEYSSLLSVALKDAIAEWTLGDWLHSEVMSQSMVADTLKEYGLL